jgi:Cu-processing system permease protein
MNNVLTITWLTFHEARRRSMVLVALALGIVFVLLFSLGFGLIVAEIRRESGERAWLELTFAYSMLLTAGLYVVHFLAVMLAIFASVDTVSGEIASHTIQALVTKPVRRWEIMIGKWLGYAVMLLLYLGMLIGGLLLSVYLQEGYLPPNPIQGMAMFMLEALVLLSLSLLGGTRFSTLTNGVLLFLFYGVAFVGSWIEQIGALFQSAAALRVGIVTSLLMPVEALWRRSAYLMQPPLLSGSPTPFTSASAPSVAMVFYAILYSAVVLGLAVRSFGRRDL